MGIHALLYSVVNWVKPRPWESRPFLVPLILQSIAIVQNPFQLLSRAYLQPPLCLRPSEQREPSLSLGTGSTYNCESWHFWEDHSFLWRSVLAKLLLKAIGSRFWKKRATEQLQLGPEFLRSLIHTSAPKICWVVIQSILCIAPAHPMERVLRPSVKRTDFSVDSC